MSSRPRLASLASVLVCAAWFTPVVADDKPPGGEADGQRARPAVLIVPVWDSPPHLGRPEYVRPPSQVATPEIGPEYELVQTYVPNPMWPRLRYYVYMDLSDPAVARRWRQLRQAERAEQWLDRMERFNRRDMQQRKERLLSRHDQAVRDGLAAMRAGDYRQAVLDLTLAAELNQGDPACRIHLAQARVALGHDAEAAKSLRRALELQPKLVPTRLRLEQYYPREEDFDAEVDALAQRISSKPGASAEEYYLLGFMEFQRGRFDQAQAAFLQAARGLPKDDRVQMYLELTRPVAR